MATENELRLIRLPEVMRLTGYGRDTIYRLGKKPETGFPRPTKICAGGRASAWVYGEVLGYLQSRIAQRPQAAA